MCSTNVTIFCIRFILVMWTLATASLALCNIGSTPNIYVLLLLCPSHKLFKWDLCALHVKEQSSIKVNCLKFVTLKLECSELKIGMLDSRVCLMEYGTHSTFFYLSLYQLQTSTFLPCYAHLINSSCGIVYFLTSNIILDAMGHSSHKFNDGFKLILCASKCVCV